MNQNNQAMRTCYILFVLVFIASNTVLSQDMQFFYVDSEGFTVSQVDLRQAETLSGIHSRYEEDWVKSYISTEIQYTRNYLTVSAVGTGNTLTLQQKEVLKLAQVDGKIKIIVDYIPENTLSSNSPQQMEYYFTVVPHKAAEFLNGEEAFNEYFEMNVIANLDSTQKKLLVLSILDFTVSTEGKIEDVNLVEGTGNIELDAYLQQALCDSPAWKPAETHDGTPVQNSLRFYISNSVSNCLAYRGISKKRPE